MGTDKVKGLYSYDFDGVLHKHAGWRADFGPVDFSGIAKGQARGYAAAVMTCNDVTSVGIALQVCGFRVCVDHRMEHMYWHDPEVVLVTGRKVAATAYFDDRAVNFQYGDDWDGALDAAEELTRSRREREAA